jgi:hypothetical protein
VQQGEQESERDQPETVLECLMRTADAQQTNKLAALMQAFEASGAVEDARNRSTGAAKGAPQPSAFYKRSGGNQQRTVRKPRPAPRPSWTAPRSPPPFLSTKIEAEIHSRERKEHAFLSKSVGFARQGEMMSLRHKANRGSKTDSRKGKMSFTSSGSGGAKVAGNRGEGCSQASTTNKRLFGEDPTVRRQHRGGGPSLSPTGLVSRIPDNEYLVVDTKECPDERTHLHSQVSYDGASKIWRVRLFPAKLQEPPQWEDIHRLRQWLEMKLHRLVEHEAAKASGDLDSRDSGRGCKDGDGDAGVDSPLSSPLLKGVTGKMASVTQRGIWEEDGAASGMSERGRNATKAIMKSLLVQDNALKGCDSAFLQHKLIPLLRECYHEWRRLFTAFGQPPSASGSWAAVAEDFGEDTLRVSTGRREQGLSSNKAELKQTDLDLFESWEQMGAWFEREMTKKRQEQQATELKAGQVERDLDLLRNEVQLQAGLVEVQLKKQMAHLEEINEIDVRVDEINGFFAGVGTFVELILGDSMAMEETHRAESQGPAHGGAVASVNAAANTGVGASTGAGVSVIVGVTTGVDPCEGEGRGNVKVVGIMSGGAGAGTSDVNISHADAGLGLAVGKGAGTESKSGGAASEEVSACRAKALERADEIALERMLTRQCIRIARWYKHRHSIDKAARGVIKLRKEVVSMLEKVPVQVQEKVRHLVEASSADDSGLPSAMEEKEEADLLSQAARAQAGQSSDSDSDIGSGSDVGDLEQAMASIGKRMKEKTGTELVEERKEDKRHGSARRAALLEARRIEWVDRTTRDRMERSGMRLASKWRLRVHRRDQGRQRLQKTKNKQARQRMTLHGVTANTVQMFKECDVGCQTEWEDGEKVFEPAPTKRLQVCADQPQGSSQARLAVIAPTTPRGSSLVVPVLSDSDFDDGAQTLSMSMRLATRLVDEMQTAATAVSTQSLPSDPSGIPIAEPQLKLPDCYAFLLSVHGDYRPKVLPLSQVLWRIEAVYDRLTALFVADGTGSNSDEDEDERDELAYGSTPIVQPIVPASRTASLVPPLNESDGVEGRGGEDTSAQSATNVRIGTTKLTAQQQRASWASQERRRRHEQRLPAMSGFLSDYFLGSLQSTEEAHLALIDFLACVAEHAERNTRCSVFARLCGLECYAGGPHHQPPPSDALGCEDLHLLLKLRHACLEQANRSNKASHASGTRRAFKAKPEVGVRTKAGVGSRGGAEFELWQTDESLRWADRAALRRQIDLVLTRQRLVSIAQVPYLLAALDELPLTRLTTTSRQQQVSSFMVSTDDAFAAILEARGKAIECITDWLRFFYHKYKHADKIPALEDVEEEKSSTVVSLTFQREQHTQSATLSSHSLLPYTQFYKLVAAVAPEVDDLAVCALYRRAVVETNSRRQAGSDITPGLFAEVVARSLDIGLQLQ